MRAEVDAIIHWLAGYEQEALESQLESGTDLEPFVAQAPRLNPSRSSITDVVCGIRVEDIEEPSMREIRFLETLIDEMARGKAMGTIPRTH